MNDMAGNPVVENFVSCHGIRFPDDPGVISRRIRRALRTEGYENREYEAVRALVGPDDVVLELGAGIGFMSSVAARLCRAREVQTFEANPALISYIRSVHDLNDIKNVTVTNALLGPRARKPVDFHVRKNLLASSMSPLLGDRDGGVVSVEKVRVLGVNTVLKKLKPTVLICDIEGGEASLLPAADLSCLNIAIVELHPQWIGQAGVGAVFEAMRAAGLTYFPKRSNKKVVTFRKGW
ncbi:MAG: FkbM family methyltransferase [Paracoccaceae bacterium]